MQGGPVAICNPLALLDCDHVIYSLAFCMAALARASSSACAFCMASLSTVPTVDYEFPNGLGGEFGAERYRIAETLFNPSLFRGAGGQNMLNVAHACTTSVGQSFISRNLHWKFEFPGVSPLCRKYSVKMRKVIEEMVIY